MLGIKRRRLSSSEYHQMIVAGIFHEDERLELIEGELIQVSPIGSEHAGVVMRLTQLLSLALGQDYIVNVQNPLMLEDGTEPEPDLQILRFRDDYYTTSHPTAQDVLLLIEVAKATLDYDTHVKAALYARAGIPSYWLVDLQHTCIKVHKAAAEQGYLEVESINSGALMLPNGSSLEVQDILNVFQ